MKKIKIGARRSALAMLQTDLTIKRIVECNAELSVDDFEIVGIVTQGDKILDRKLCEIGGKEVFTKEIEISLMDGAIDIAVHSMKDVEASYPSSLEFCCILPRGNPFDVLVSRKHKSIDQLPKNAVVGTSSLRRELFLKRCRDDLQIKPVRGNIYTRLQRVDDGEYDAIILAAAAVERLDIAQEYYSYIPESVMLPGVCQGAIGVQSRKSDEYIRQILVNANHEDSYVRMRAERGFVEFINGNCRTALAAFSKIDGDSITLEAMLANEDFSKILLDRVQGPTAHAFQLGQRLAKKMQKRL